MARAHLAAAESKDTTQVGAVLVAPDGRARLLDAYNGPPAGVHDLPERFERPAKYLYASHAEANLISFAARHGIRTEGCTVYCTHSPCDACARSMIQAGIACVVVGEGTTSMEPEKFEAARTMLREAKVGCWTLTGTQTLSSVAPSVSTPTDKGPTGAIPGFPNDTYEAKAKRDAAHAAATSSAYYYPDYR